MRCLKSRKITASHNAIDRRLEYIQKRCSASGCQHALLHQVLLTFIHHHCLSPETPKDPEGPFPRRWRGQDSFLACYCTSDSTLLIPSPSQVTCKCSAGLSPKPATWKPCVTASFNDMWRFSNALRVRTFSSEMNCHIISLNPFTMHEAKRDNYEIHHYCW